MQLRGHGALSPRFGKVNVFRRLDNYKHSYAGKLPKMGFKFTFLYRGFSLNIQIGGTLAKKMRDAKEASRQTEATEAISHYLSTVSRKAVALSFEGVMV